MTDSKGTSRLIMRKKYWKYLHIYDIISSRWNFHMQIGVIAILQVSFVDSIIVDFFIISRWKIRIIDDIFLVSCAVMTGFFSQIYPIKFPIETNPSFCHFLSFTLFVSAFHVTQIMTIIGKRLRCNYSRFVSIPTVQKE